MESQANFALIYVDGAVEEAELDVSTVATAKAAPRRTGVMTVWKCCQPFCRKAAIAGQP